MVSFNGMKFKNGYIEIQADKFLYRYSKLSGTKGNALAAAYFPFILTTKKLKERPEIFQKGIINHELIHFEQQKETLFLGLFFFAFLENIYYRLFKKIPAWDAYLLHAREQEAYDNMWNPDYLKTRKRYAWLRNYIKHKPVTWVSVMMNNFKMEGFIHVYEWKDEPNTAYPKHKHRGKVSIYVVEGSVSFTSGLRATVTKGNRTDVPVGVEHEAIVGSEGCHYVVGEEIEGDS